MVERLRGAFIRVRTENEEPARTERLLARPYSLARKVPSDALDACHIGLLSRAGGHSWRAAYFEVAILIAQLTVGALNGLGPGLGLLPGSAASVAQLVVIACVQVLSMLYTLCTSASYDRLMTLTVSLQFALEAGQTIFLLAFSFSSDPSLERASFTLALAAVFTPVILVCYDLFIVHVYQCAQRKSNWRDFITNAFFFVLMVPTIVLRLLGVNVSVKADELASGAASDLIKLSTPLANSRAQVQDTLAASDAKGSMPENDESVRSVDEIWPTISQKSAAKLQVGYPVQIVPERVRKSLAAVPDGRPPQREDPRPGFQWVMQQSLDK